MDAPYHRRIELQSPEDFAFVVNNVRRAAAASVAEAFPPVENVPEKKGRGKGRKKTDEDDLHARVEALVNEYIFRTYSLAAPNLTINGLPVDPAPFFGDKLDTGADGEDAEEEEQEVFEPFDGRKRQRVEDLAREEEDLLRDIAALKRRVPPAVVRAHARRLETAVAADAATTEATMTATAAAAAAAEEAVWAQQDEAVQEQNDSEGSSETAFAQAVAGLGRLKQAMPATVARMERARVAGHYAAAER